MVLCKIVNALRIVYSGCVVMCFALFRPCCVENEPVICLVCRHVRLLALKPFRIASLKLFCEGERFGSWLGQMQLSLQLLHT